MEARTIGNPPPLRIHLGREMPVLRGSFGPSVGNGRGSPHSKTVVTFNHATAVLHAQEMDPRQSPPGGPTALERPLIEARSLEGAPETT